MKKLLDLDRHYILAILATFLLFLLVSYIIITSIVGIICHLQFLFSGNNLSLVLQRIVMLMVKTFPRKKLFVESASLSYVKVERHSRWNVVAKENLLWLTKNVL